MNRLIYTVFVLRDAGLEARWSRTRSGGPVIVCRDPQSAREHQRSSWWIVDRVMWDSMQRHGIREGFLAHTLTGDCFSIANNAEVRSC